MKVYVAAPWRRREEARIAARFLIAEGHTVTSRWHDVHGDTTDPDQLAVEAIHDLVDIETADVFLLLNLQVSEGKAVETGVALMEGLQVIGVGTPSNVFHYLPEITWVASVAEAIDALRDESPTPAGS